MVRLIAHESVEGDDGAVLRSAPGSMGS
jgi:hypothetical protein